MNKFSQVSESQANDPFFECTYSNEYMNTKDIDLRRVHP